MTGVCHRLCTRLLLCYLPTYSTLEFVRGDAEPITGYTAAESEEPVVRAESIIHPEDREQLLQESRKVHEFQQFLDRERRDHRSLRTVVNTLHEEAARFPDAEFEVVCDPGEDATVLDIVEVALVEPVENAFVHGDEYGPVRVTVERPSLSHVAFSIRDEGAGLPEMEQRVLDGAVEEPLNHSHGFGLWMAYWLVQITGGSITQKEGERPGTTRRVHVPVTDGGN